jgi:hypothetical protein
MFRWKTNDDELARRRGIRGKVLSILRSGSLIEVSKKSAEPFFLSLFAPC